MRTGERRNHHAAGFGLPPGVDNGAATLAYDAVIPLPSFGINRFTDRADNPQRAAIMAGDQFVTETMQGPDRSGCSEEEIDLVFGNNLPEAIALREGRYALEHQ